jgi:hypothetical protein
VCLDSAMPRIPKSPLALVFVLFRVWRRLPPAQRRLVMRLAWAHSPRIAAGAAASARRRRARP